MIARASFASVGIWVGPILAWFGIIAPRRDIPTLEATALACAVIAFSCVTYAALSRARQ